LPKEAFPKAFRETGVLILLSLFHDGDRITLEYGDVYYINSAPRPFIAGVMSSLEDTGGIVNVVPNFNLAYDDKVQYFIHNYEKIDATGMLASTFVSQIMPALQKPIKLKGFAAMDSTVAEVYMKEIEEFVGAVPKSAYTSTETNHSSIASVQYPLGFIFDWRRGVFEVLPIKEGKRVKDELIGLEDAKVGEVYNLIYTSFDGELTRYDTGDVLLCVARGDDIINTDFPVFKFYARSEKTIELHSFTRISEEELLTVFKESNISLVDFTTRVEIDRGLQYLVIYMAYRGDMTTKDIEERVHNKLFEIDRDYKELVEFFKYKPIRVQRVPKEVLEEYLRGKIAGVPKVEKIKMREEEFNRLLRIMERHKKCR
ncbi:MAG: GH3 auxin-responsive promoter family protein, partial [Candidatus Bathyarchaeota archaeon]|nr:GH3 auxin-responsive promoter family protein [Candidatus Bathyarchaeota archaeon]